MIDLHTHTFHTDGELGPEELLRRAEEVGVEGLAITDHVDSVTLPNILDLYRSRWSQLREVAPFPVVLGCELTHVMPDSVDSLAQQAHEAGASLVLVHGESPVEPVRSGTNEAAASSDYVDILAHPGILEPGVAEQAAENNVALELSGRPGHAFGNGHVGRIGQEVGVDLTFSTDAHAPDDLMTPGQAEEVIRGAGVENPQTVLDYTEELFFNARERSSTNPGGT